MYEECLKSLSDGVTTSVQLPTLPSCDITKPNRNSWPEMHVIIGDTGGLVKRRCSYKITFLGKLFYFYNWFSQSAILPVYLFVFLFVNLHFYLIIFQH